MFFNVALFESKNNMKINHSINGKKILIGGGVEGE